MYLTRLKICSGEFPQFDVFPYNIELFHKSPFLSLNHPVTFFAGENGTGKSTLLRAISRRCNIHIWETGDRTPMIFNPHAENLYNYISLEKTDKKLNGSFFGSEIFRHFAELLDEWAKTDPRLLDYFGGKSLTTKSHGQCNMSFFENRFKLPGLYLLDEPESALSPKSQIELLKIITNASMRGDVQFIIATHSPILLALRQSVIYSFNHDYIQQIPYEETDYYILYRDFLNNPLKFLQGTDEYIEN
jgi:predicted ATPase